VIPFYNFSKTTLGALIEFYYCFN